jgi:hypothetical protein
LNNYRRLLNLTKKLEEEEEDRKIIKFTPRGTVGTKPPDLGDQQIISGPLFSDSSYKNRLVAYFSALEDQF